MRGTLGNVRCKRKLDDSDYCVVDHSGDKSVEKEQPAVKRLRTATNSPRKTQAAATAAASPRRPVLEDTTHKQVNSPAATTPTTKKSSPKKKQPAAATGTPSKVTALTEEMKQEFELRRSPRKHAGSPATPTAASLTKPSVGYSTIKISGEICTFLDRCIKIKENK